MSQVTIRIIEEHDLESFLSVRRKALESDPFAFTASPGSDVSLDSEFVKKALRNRSSQAIFGAWTDKDELIGIVGVFRCPNDKENHKAKLWGLYVDRSYRKQGLGSALLAAAIEFASSMYGIAQIQLAVSGTSKAAFTLYERRGFVTWGVEQNAILIDGRYDSLSHMVFGLDEVKA